MNPWRWFLCRVVDYHHWVGRECSVCHVDVFGPRRKGFSLADWLHL